MILFKDFSTVAFDYSTGDPWTDPRFKYPQSFTKAELDEACAEYGLGEWDRPGWDERHPSSMQKAWSSAALGPKDWTPTTPIPRPPKDWTKNPFEEAKKRAASVPPKNWTR